MLLQDVTRRSRGDDRLPVKLFVKIRTLPNNAMKIRAGEVAGSLRGDYTFSGVTWPGQYLTF